MKLFLIFTLIASFSYAKCVGSPSIHNDFCSDNDQGDCEMQAVCEWKEPKVEVKVIKKSKSCKGSPSIHNDFCEEFDEDDCGMHAVCDWK